MPATHPDWASIALLGSLHGVNPAMGWLFAVSLGLQRQSGRAVWSALAPLALGHALAVGAAVVVAVALGTVLSPSSMKWLCAAALLGFGVVHMRSHVHVRSGMCVGPRQLTVWSFLVSSAHGAGLMVLPFVLSGHTHAHAHAPTLLAVLLHTAAYLGMAGVIAWVVYAWLDLGFLRRAWINMNAIWAVALIVTAVATPLL
jgi:hypothetical protein